MSFENTKEVLDHVRAFHSKVSDFYRELSVQTHKQRVKMLLEYMSRHEKHLGESLAAYEKDVSKKILNTWFQFSPSKDTLPVPEKMTIVNINTLTVDDIIDMALKLDELLVRLYEEMVKCSESPEVKEVFENLLEMEKREEHRFVKDALRLKEL